jgi:hypothetical protein
MLHAACTRGNWVNSQLLVVWSSLTLGLPFDHNLCFRCPNGSCEPILDIYILITFQWYKKLFKLMGFDSYNRPLKIRDSIGTPIPKMGVHLGVWGFMPSHSFALLGALDVTPRLSFWPATFANPCLSHEPKVKVAIQFDSSPSFGHNFLGVQMGHVSPF